ncbi:MAG: L-aspartate oxidase [Gammaproteobacteria bacterium]|nr:L-aspartate oxidase [Gammaproteobacteria bacterium]
MPQRYTHDVLVIGSGAAGLSVAIQVADRARVAVICKGELGDGSTSWAQGGIAAVLDDEDTIDSHVADTLRAGAGLCHEDMVRFTVEHSRESIQWLVDLGVGFTKLLTPGSENEFHLTMEGGHSHRRIIHAADATGRAVSDTLIEQARRHASIELFERHIAVNLITTAGRCRGAYVLNKDTASVDLFSARFVVLATGGASKAYLYTSNLDTATGDGIAMAWRAGCRVANMEFNQFHPTCLYHPSAKSFLISEAVRGEGGVLLLPNGERFMPRFHPQAELAPRDIVARAIDHEMKRLGIDCVYLDISHKGEDFVRSHFPTIYSRCLELGLDMARAPLPVVPAAHYTCGGVMIDRAGQTDLPGLYAVGETSFTGLHGANRLASNSLLECFVFARAAAQHILAQGEKIAISAGLPDWDASQVTDSDEDVVISHNWDELRRFMWDYVGIVRTTKRLQRALSRAHLLKQEIAEYYSNYRITSDLVELRNLALVAELIIRSALGRHESRGLHYTLDHPGLAAEAGDSVLTPG